MRAALGDNHLVGVRIHDKVGVVCDDNDLPPRFCRLEALDEVIIDGFRVEIFFGLIAVAVCLGLFLLAEHRVKSQSKGHTAA